MKIIKPGKRPDTTLSFKCPWCGCEFEADDREYIIEQFITIKGFVYKAYRSCPTCNNQCFTKVIYKKEECL